MTEHITSDNARALPDSALRSLISLAEGVLAGRLETSQPIDVVIGTHRRLTAEARRRHLHTPTSHADCGHPSTKIARAQCRRQRAKIAAATPAHTLIKTEAQLAEAHARIMSKGCHGTVKSGARKGARCGRPVVTDTVLCSGHHRATQI